MLLQIDSILISFYNSCFCNISTGRQKRLIASRKGAELLLWVKVIHQFHLLDRREIISFLQEKEGFSTNKCSNKSVLSLWTENVVKYCGDRNVAQLLCGRKLRLYTLGTEVSFKLGWDRDPGQLPLGQKLWSITVWRETLVK